VAAVLVNPPALPSPTNLRVTPTTTDAVTLAWDPPPDASGITGYTVYIDALAATTTPATSITVGLSCGTTNRLGVSAFGSDGRTSPVSVVTVSARACPVTHYNCPAAADGASHYVPAGKHWGNAFVAQGHTITGGTLLIGANVDGQDHRAQIGIFTGGPDQLSGELGSTVVDVHDYGGASFSFPSPIAVTPGQLLWLVAIGIGDFTAYDRKDNGADGCFIGSLVGFE
jgi:hypothetical protein